MKYNEIIRAVQKEKGMSQTELAEKLGVSNQAVISTQLRRNDIYLSSFVRILDALGYEVVVQQQGNSLQNGQMRCAGTNKEKD